jgi:hypothetical protein
VTNEPKESRRDFVKKVVYASPLIVTLPATPALATAASPPRTARDADVNRDTDRPHDTDIPVRRDADQPTHDLDPPQPQRPAPSAIATPRRRG